MKCPLCKKKFSAPDFAPFCSRYCQNQDFIAWVKGDYRIAGPSKDGEESSDDQKTCDENGQIDPQRIQSTLP